MLKILIVCSGTTGPISPFIKDQVDALRKLGIELDFFTIKNKGVSGYITAYGRLLRLLKGQQYDLIHAHYGLSGFISSIQRKVPCVITFHGSDIRVMWTRILSFLASRFSTHNIFVHPSQPPKVFAKRNYTIIPCGLDLQVFFPRDRSSCRGKMKLAQDGIYGLFSSAFNNSVKNYPLAKKAVDLLDTKVKILELKGYSRNEVARLMNAVDFLLVTSHSETGPLVVKEAMACNCAIVSTDVGDVTSVIGSTPGCYLTSFDPMDVAAKLKMALEFSKAEDRTHGRDRIIELGLDSETIARKIINVYQKVLGRR